MKGGKPGQRVRRRGALTRLETRLAETKAGKHDSYYEGTKESAINRMEREIETLKKRIQ